MRVIWFGVRAEVAWLEFDLGVFGLDNHDQTPSLEMVSLSQHASR